MVAAIQAVIEANLVELHTSMPGTVESYDANLQQANIRPNLKRKFTTDDGSEIVDLPIINNVPVCWTRTASAFIHLPLKSGDQVLIICSERSIDTWKTAGSQQYPDDPRRHNLTDAVAIPGCWPFSTPMLDVDPDALMLVNGVGQVKVAPDGKVSFGNKSVDLVKLFDDTLKEVSDLADKTSAMTILTSVGPGSVSPGDVTALQQIKTNIDLIKTTLAAILA